MGLHHIDTLLSKGQADSITGGLIRTSIEAAKLELGTGSTLFQTNYKKFGQLLTACWIMHTWKFMSEFDITLIEGTATLPLRRVGDKFIINYFHQYGFKGKELLRLNRCRLFLQVMTVADIATADGKFITIEAWHGSFDNTRLTYHSWPRPYGAEPSLSHFAAAK
jgi:hypothetical protein